MTRLPSKMYNSVLKQKTQDEFANYFITFAN